MQTSRLTWEQAKNRLASGLAREVKYTRGQMASYRLNKSGECLTYYSNTLYGVREPCNKHYLFRIVS